LGGVPKADWPATGADPVHFETLGVPEAQAKPTKVVRAEVASHEVLFEPAPAMRCDACGVAMGGHEEGDGNGISGRGVYLWLRGSEVHLEDAPLCASCASAIGMTALARWEIEEEEG
jgi:hypothetical protein